MVHEPSRPLAPSPKFHLPFQGLSYMALSTLVLDLQVPLSGRVGYFGHLVGSHLGHLIAFVPSGREVLLISCRFVASRCETYFQLVSSLDVFFVSSVDFSLTCFVRFQCFCSNFGNFLGTSFVLEDFSNFLK